MFLYVYVGYTNQALKIMILSFLCGDNIKHRPIELNMLKMSGCQHLETECVLGKFDPKENMLLQVAQQERDQHGHQKFCLSPGFLPASSRASTGHPLTGFWPIESNRLNRPEVEIMICP